MNMSGGCYCGKVRYEISGDPLMKGQCHCRQCQHIAGGAPQYYMVFKTEDFRFTAGTVKTFERQDIDDPVSRAFCETCGTHISTRRPDFDGVILKVGTLDDPACFQAPRIAIFTKEAQPFHHIPTDLARFEGLPDF